MTLFALSRWRHGFESRWGYQTESPAIAGLSAFSGDLYICTTALYIGIGNPIGNPLSQNLGTLPTTSSPTGRARRPFHYKDKGIMAMIGDGAAVARWAFTTTNSTATSRSRRGSVCTHG